VSALGAAAALGEPDPVDFLPRVLPAEWSLVGRSEDGAQYRSLRGLVVIVSAAVELDGKAWLHVSMSRRDRLPSYDDMKAVKDVFMGRERTALQVFAPSSKHVNIHDFCLHLWACLDGDATPDFTRGSGSL
jgi:hypothetical protein